jgi:pimeloyl-ACP methyl ester carboxylesterase
MIEHPSFFLGGEEDRVKDIGGGFSEERLRKALPGLVGWQLLLGVGHWPELEAAEATNAALVRFLGTISFSAQ